MIKVCPNFASVWRGLFLSHSNFLVSSFPPVEFRSRRGKMGAIMLCLSMILVLVYGQGTTDIECLRKFKSSVKDPQGYLGSWNFESSPQICLFTGVTCLHQNDSKVYTLSLPSAGLSGKFPDGLKLCSSLTTLDLSDNSFTGPIPDDLCTNLLPYLVTFNVRSNDIGFNLPGFANCTYLNNLDVSQNKLTGPIPDSIGTLTRLTKFDVSGNDLSGPIPVALKNMSSSYFAGNSKLCGQPINNKKCRASGTGGSKSNNVPLIAGVTGGGVLALVAVVVLCIWFIPVKVRPIKGISAENRWAKRIKAPHAVTVSMFEKPLEKIKLTDLMAATNEFSQENIIGSGRTGVMYKASFPDGTVMAIKRLKLSTHSDKEFKSEMDTLGRLRHRNLVPLLGYCVADTERLLVYKYMANGSLKDWLHGSQYTLDWPKRLKIAIGGCRGLAWLHHSCNPRIIHRNISAASLLLDEDFEARITDFGLARLMNPVDTHISTFINGDFGDVGYVAPEYVRTLVATVRGDVFSMGVVLLELVTGQKPVEVEDGTGFKGSLVEWIVLNNKNGTLASVIHESLRGGPDVEAEVMQFLKVAVNCVTSAAKDRPSSYEVYQMIRSIGQKYHFSDQNDEIPLFDSVVVDIDTPDELIVNAAPGGGHPR